MNIVKHIGSGSYGNVYLCNNFKAIKVFKNVDTMFNSNGVKEIYLTKLVYGSYIDKIYYNDKYLSYTMKFMNSGTLGSLASYINKTDKIKILSKLCDNIFQSLLLIHKNGLIHNDVKLDNILCHYNYDENEKEIIEQYEKDLFNSSNSTISFVSCAYNKIKLDPNKFEFILSDLGLSNYHYISNCYIKKYLKPKDDMSILNIDKHAIAMTILHFLLGFDVITSYNINQYNYRTVMKSNLKEYEYDMITDKTWDILDVLFREYKYCSINCDNIYSKYYDFIFRNALYPLFESKTILSYNLTAVIEQVLISCDRNVSDTVYHYIACEVLSKNIRYECELDKDKQLLILVLLLLEISPYYLYEIYNIIFEDRDLTYMQIKLLNNVK